MKITAPFLVLAGETAPSPGILLSNSGVHVSASNVAISHLEIRPGDEKTGEAPRERDTWLGVEPHFRAMVKLTLANPRPAPIAVLLLDCVPESRNLRGRLDLLLEIARRLLSASPQVQRLFVALLGSSDSEGVLEMSRQGSIAQRWLLAIADQYAE